MKCPYCDGTGQLEAAAHMGAVLKAAREGAGMTQEQVSAKIGRSRAQIANIEAGRSEITVSLLGQFAAAFGVSMKELVP